jgi:general secretion pathway protein D
VGVNTQFSYTDVGVIMEITPRVHPDGQVSLKLSMEISNVSSQSTIGGITQPIISTRKAEQTIRLNDGEVSLLGGILEQQESRSRSGTPFLGSIPILRYLFSSEKIDHINNEIVFLLIPHVVRGQELNDLNRRTFDVGTGSGIDLRIASKPPRVESAPASAPAAATVATPPPVQPPVTAERPIVAPPVSQPQRAAPQGPPVPATPAETSPPVPSTGGGQVSLKLAPESVAPQQGSTFALNIVLAHGQDIASVPIQISYDPKVVQFQSVSNGDYLARDGQQVALVFRDDAAAGKLQITAQRPPGSTGISGDGTVFSLVFMAKAKGTGAVAISIPGARNSQNQMVETLGSQAAVNVN